jgi:hypothetical protein
VPSGFRPLQHIPFSRIGGSAVAWVDGTDAENAGKRRSSVPTGRRERPNGESVFPPGTVAGMVMGVAPTAVVGGPDPRVLGLCPPRWSTA